MKKAFLFSLALIPTSLFGFQIPLDRDGVSAESLDDVGVLVFTTTHSNVAQSIFDVTPPTAALTQGASIAIFGILTSTLPTGRVPGDVFFQVRSSDTLNESSELLLPEIPISSTTENTFLQFNPPVIAPIRALFSIRSVSVDITSDTVPASVFYRFIATNTESDVWIPIDEFSGRKVHDKSFYGVQVATQVIPGNGINNGVGTDALDNTSDERLLTSTSVLTSSFLYGWMAGTGTVTNYVVFEDTEGVSATTPARPTIVPIFYNAGVFNPGNVEWKAKAYSFPWPVFFSRGITQRRDSSTDQFRVFKRPTQSVR